MARDSIWPFRQVLDPIERISEVLFGLIMVLTITSTFSVVGADRVSVGAMIVAALGCNLAWGIIDGGLYLLANLGDRAKDLLAAHAVRRTSDPEEAKRIIADALPPLVASALPPEQFEKIRQDLLRMPEPPPRPKLTKTDWLGAFAICLVVFFSTFPVVLPFLFTDDVRFALRLSNLVAIAMLFGCGYAFGRCTGYRPWTMGIVMVLIGIALTGVAILLGG